MDKIRKHAGRAAAIMNTLRIIFLVLIVACVIGAVMGFAMGGYISMYYNDPSNLERAMPSLNAEMGIFGFLPFAALKSSGQYGAFFALQLLCWGVTMLVYEYTFKVLCRIFGNIRDKGTAFDIEGSKKEKRAFVIITILSILFHGFLNGLITGFVLCALFLVSECMVIGNENKE